MTVIEIYANFGMENKYVYSWAPDLGPSWRWKNYMYTSNQEGVS